MLKGADRGMLMWCDGCDDGAQHPMQVRGQKIMGVVLSSAAVEKHSAGQEVCSLAAGSGELAFVGDGRVRGCCVGGRVWDKGCQSKQ